jgi:hypothetical protein
VPPSCSIKSPSSPLDTPALRPLELTPVRVQGQNMIMVRDPIGLIEGAALLVPDPLLILFLELADGKTTLGEMAQKATMMTGQILPQGLFDSLTKQLDDALLLQSEKFRAALQKKYDDFLNSPTRPYKGLPDEREGPAGDAEGVGRRIPAPQDEFAVTAAIARASPWRSERDPCRRTSTTSAAASCTPGRTRALKEYGNGARTFIVLGTNHRPTQNRFIGHEEELRHAVRGGGDGCGAG